LISSLPLCLFCFRGNPPSSGPGPPHSRDFWITHKDETQSVGLLWTSDQLVPETSTWQQTTLTTDRYQCPRYDSNPQSQQTSGRRPTPSTAQPLGPDLTLCNTSLFFTRSVQIIFSILLQHHTSKIPSYFWSTFRSVHVSAP
jgi:hypothetical protein